MIGHGYPEPPGWGIPSFNLLSADSGKDHADPHVQPQILPAVTNTAGVTLNKSFADAVMAGRTSSGKGKSFNAFKNPIPISFENIHAGNPSKEEKVGIKKLTNLGGRPCLYLSEEELLILAQPLEFSLIGKFSTSRPKWIALNRYFMELKLHGAYKLASLDSRHFVIHLNNFDDYTRIFSRPVTSLKGHIVKYFKWSMDFDVNIEPPITPIWISMALLRMNMFTQNMLFSLAQAFGKPLMIDPSTAFGNNPGIARILVEMNVLEDHPKDVWIGNRASGYAQVVEIEKKPKYCSFCRKYGHLEHECYMKNPNLSKVEKNKEPRKKTMNPPVAQEKDKEEAAQVSREEETSNHCKSDEAQGASQEKEAETVKKGSKDDQAETFWNEYKEQMRREGNAIKNLNQTMEAEEKDEADKMLEEGEIQDVQCEAARENPEDSEYECYKNIAQQVIFQVTEKIYEECYNKAFSEERIELEEAHQKATTEATDIVQGKAAQLPWNEYSDPNVNQSTNWAEVQSSHAQTESEGTRVNATQFEALSSRSGKKIRKRRRKSY